jgi:hypothetical protein
MKRIEPGDVLIHRAHGSLHFPRKSQDKNILNWREDVTDDTSFAFAAAPYSRGLFSVLMGRTQPIGIGGLSSEWVIQCSRSAPELGLERRRRLSSWPKRGGAICDDCSGALILGLMRDVT